MASRRGHLRWSLLCALAALTVLLGGCSPVTVDIRERLSLFMVNLNAADRSTLNSHFDQALTQDLPLMDATWWDANFPAPPDTAHHYEITITEYVDPANVQAAIVGPSAFNLNTGLARDAVLVMSLAGTEWLIHEVFLDGSSTPLIQ